MEFECGALSPPSSMSLISAERLTLSLPFQIKSKTQSCIRRPLRTTVARNCHIKYKSLTSKTNCSNQILNCLHQKQNPYIKYKSRHQIQSPDIKTRIKRSAVGERKLVSTWCNHHTVYSGFTLFHMQYNCSQRLYYIGLHTPT